MAVTDRPPADAVADCALHAEDATHAHRFNPTRSSAPGFGLEPITGVISFNKDCACAANCAGLGAVAAGGVASHTTVVVVADFPALKIGSWQVLRYQAPDPVGWGSAPAGGWYVVSSVYVHGGMNGEPTGLGLAA